MPRNAIDFEQVWDRAQGVFALGTPTFHGPDHWRRVEETGRLLAASTGADPDLVRLFAILHDCKREHESADPDHGRRAAAYARTLRWSLFPLDDERFALLEQAIALHADGLVSEDPTIGTCWDADRLDLPRVGMWPSPELLSTSAAKELLGKLLRSGAAERRTAHGRWELG